MSNKGKKIFVALSGGVDSSVAAALLKKQGYQVIGCHIRCFNIDGCGERDANDARRVAEQLKIPFYVFDLEQEYKDKVVRYMVDGYKNGLTPNPDVMCNKEIKFGLFLKRALKLGADFVATGHYVKNQKSLSCRQAGKIKNQNHNSKSKTIYRLFTAKDLNKDQSYFLWTLTQKQLKHCLFPIGDYTKKQVRALAKKFGLLTANKKDSQGICFLGKVTLVDFLKRYIPEKRGLVLNTAGKKVGEHNGAYFYTIGQRHGLNLSLGRPYYIVQKNTFENVIIVKEVETYQKAINLRDINLINTNFKNPVWARVRYRQPLTKAILNFTSSQDAKLEFIDGPQKFIAPGQSAVFYDSRGGLLGGGIIC